MRKYSFTLLLVALVGANFLLCGYTVPSVPAYFTIQIENKSIIVNDEFLRGGWYNTRSARDFAKGQTLRERAMKAKVDKNIQNLVKKDFPEIWHLVQKLKRDVEIKPYDGHISFTPNPTQGESRFNVTGQKSGRDLDEDKLYKDILATLQSGEHKIILASVKDVAPKTEDAVLAKIGMRSGYTTYFENNPAREHNIALALSCFNGLVVQNGETVSFNKVVGVRTAERGYREAKIILDGEFVPGVGGGVCQASTTLFNAVLTAGLEIEKSHNHSLAISYVPIGRDAMVSSAADLRFTNNTGGTIYIEAGATNATENKSGRAFVRIYGNKTKVKYKPRTEVTEMDLKDDEIDPARKSTTYIEAYSGDRLVHSKLVRKSTYKARKAEKVVEKSEPIDKIVTVQ